METSPPFTSRLVSSYLALVRRLDGRTGPQAVRLTRWNAALLGLRPEFRPLDRATRTAAYRDVRRLIESDPAIAAAAWSYLLLLAVVFVFGLAGALATLGWVVASPGDSLVANLAGVVGIVTGSVALGALVGFLVGRRAFAGLTMPDWRAVAAGHARGAAPRA